jgi:hypothetical protein
LITDLNISAEEIAHFQQLLRTDRVANLKARYAFFEDYNPQLCKERFGFVPQLIDQLVIVVGLPSESFSYTIGMNYFYGKPDLMFFNPYCEMHTRKNILNTFVAYAAKGHDLEVDVDYVQTLFADSVFHFSDLNLRVYDSSDFSHMPCGYLYSFFRFFQDQDIDDSGPPMLVAENFDEDVFDESQL